MSPVSRGIRNAFRNGIRTVSIVVILGLSIGLCLTMLIAHEAVNSKISSVKSSIGNTVSVSAAGTLGFQGGGNPLSQSTVDKLRKLAHVTSVAESLQDQLRNTSGTNRQGTTETANTSLQSAIDAGSLGARFGAYPAGGSSSASDNGQPPTRFGGFTPPISAYGLSDPTQVNGNALTIKSGNAISGTSDKAVALVGTGIAGKNNLSAGSTFTAYGSTVTVSGIFDTGTNFGNNAVIFSLPTLQRLSGQTGQLTSAVVTADSVSNVDSVTSAVKNALGSSADVTSSKDEVASALAPLDSVKTISLVSLIGAVIAAAVIILLTMVMVVRERQREIGVVKAIGGSNLRIMSEFAFESLTLALLGTVIGLIIGVLGAQPVTKLLVNNSTSSAASQTAPGVPDGFGRRSGFGRFRNNTALRGIANVKAQTGWSILLDGFGAALLISLIGSALASGMIAKVRPSSVMRSL